MNLDALPYTIAPDCTEWYDPSVPAVVPGSAYELLLSLVKKGPRSAALPSNLRSALAELLEANLAWVFQGAIQVTEKGEELALALERILPLMGRPNGFAELKNSEPDLRAAQLVIKTRLER